MTLNSGLFETLKKRQTYFYERVVLFIVSVLYSLSSPAIVPASPAGPSLCVLQKIIYVLDVNNDHQHNR